MLKTKILNVKWQRANKKHFQEKGYIYTNIGDEFCVNIDDLLPNSHLNIEVLCDYCNENIIKMQYKTYNNNQKKSIIKKDCCKTCWDFKLKESMIEKYGELNASNVYDIKNKRQDTFLKNFGVSNPMKVEIVKNKVVLTNIKRYGVKHLMQIKDIRIKRGIKRSQTMFDNGTAISSKQQRHINDLLKGILNYPVNNFFLDIAFPEEKIYIEYDGSGHDLDVIIGKISEKEKQIKEIKRYHILKKYGWKMIKILSNKDLLPNDLKISECFDLCKTLLNTNNNCIIDIDNKNIRLKHKIIAYDFGILNKIANNNK